jgi:hypothetical protein
MSLGSGISENSAVRATGGVFRAASPRRTIGRRGDADDDGAAWSPIMADPSDQPRRPAQVYAAIIVAFALAVIVLLYLLPILDIR